MFHCPYSAGGSLVWKSLPSTFHTFQGDDTAGSSALGQIPALAPQCPAKQRQQRFAPLGFLGSCCCHGTRVQQDSWHRAPQPPLTPVMGTQRGHEEQRFAVGSSILPPPSLPPSVFHRPSRFLGRHQGQRAVTFVLSLTPSSPKIKKKK